MHLIRLYGLTPDGHCRCAKGRSCPSPGKHPRDAEWQLGPPLSPAERDSWLAQGGNLGWRMGLQADGRVLVCLDEDEDGALVAAAAELGDLPATTTAITGSGGLHLIYQWPDNLDPPRNAVRVLAGIDVRSERGQIVVAPSRHVSGGTYRWADDREPAMLPQAWIDALANPRPRAAQTPGPAASAQRAYATEAVIAAVAPTYARGGRHELIRALGAWLARRGWTDAAIRRVAECLPSDQSEARVTQALLAASQARSGDVTVGWDVLERRLPADAAARLVGAAKDPREPADWHTTGACWSDWWAKRLPRLESRQRSRGPRLVDIGQGYHIQQDDGTYGPRRAVRPGSLLTALKRYPWDLRDDDGKPRSRESIVQDWAEYAVDFEYRFDSRGIVWDPVRRVLVYGVSAPDIPAVHDPDVAEWFEALFGAGLPAAHRFIAACHPRHMHSTLTACLVLIGAKATGKSAIAHALARMWGQHAPVRLADVCARFNGPASEGPIVLDDECAYLQRGEMTSQEFLERIQARVRKVEHKGQEKVDLFGPQRVVVNANDRGSLRFRKIRGEDSLDASADRMSWHDNIDAPRARAALARLRVPGGHDIDLDRVCKHLAWIQETTELDASERFAGAYGAAAARAELAADIEDDAAPIYDALQRAAAGEKWGEAILLEGDKLLVHPPSLLSALTIDGVRVDHRLLQRVLRHFRGGTQLEQRRSGNKVLRYWPVPVSAVLV